MPLSILFSEPGPVRDLLSVYPAVLWQEPRDPNGVILDYTLTFTRNGETRMVTTNGPQTFFVTTPASLPGVSGPFEVEVSTCTYLYSWLVCVWGESCCCCCVQIELLVEGT